MSFARCNGLPLREHHDAERGDTVSAAYGAMVMMPILFASVGYTLVSAEGTAERTGHHYDE